MNIKKITGSILIGVISIFLPLILHATPTGTVSVKIALEFEGQFFPMSGAQVTVMDREIDLELVDFRAQRDAEKSRNKKRSYHLYRYNYLVREIENSRRAGVRQVRSGIVTKRSDNKGEVLVRYLEPGDYFIGAYRKTGSGAVVWFVPFSITAGRVIQVNLDNNNVFEFYDPEFYP